MTFFSHRPNSSDFPFLFPHFPYVYYYMLNVVYDHFLTRKTPFFTLFILSRTSDNTTSQNIHSFIHYGDLYSAPSRLLLRSAPNPCTAKKKIFESIVECVRKNPGGTNAWGVAPPQIFGGTVPPVPPRSPPLG